MEDNQDDQPNSWWSIVLVLIVFIIALVMYGLIVFYAPSSKMPEMINISILSP